jgi:hypothetical protein
VIRPHLQASYCDLLPEFDTRGFRFAVRQFLHIARLPQLANTRPGRDRDLFGCPEPSAMTPRGTINLAGLAALAQQRVSGELRSEL